MTATDHADAYAHPAGHSPVRLPVEILNNIVGQLDPATDGGTFIALLQTSQSMWDLAAPRLYRNLRVDDDQLCDLLVGGTELRYQRKMERGRYAGRLNSNKGALTARTRRALGFVTRLHLYPPPVDLFDLIMVSQSKIPLFPNARTLCLEDNYDRSGPSPMLEYNHKRIPTDFVVFDRLDQVCIRGGEYSLARLRYLPCAWRKDRQSPPQSSARFHLDDIRNITIHCDDFVQVSSCQHLPSAWDSFQVFVLEAEFQVQVRKDALPGMGDLCNCLSEPPISVYFKTHDEAEATLRERWGTLDKYPNLILSFGDNPPPCKVCGK